ncbi:serine/threonine-protein kinase [Polyangium mundeleinium]|uniref:Serine/threonine-protein kinase n=1 Tax=Polyangium mundeleinium TaxID=2995306 RepID=A0ABT5F116_9BACT|nr:serine/threonine-protein kinase [Polyangium mundeleinium]MDC0746862.1 serine/threonine-protein kinase [Polyangium mundeleinium]
MAIHPGDILAGYRVTRLLGRGGMGEVWAARSDTTGRDVAIKVLLARAAVKPDLVQRFQREAKIASAIQSPYVCSLLDVGLTPDGAHLLVFEKLDGESLADRLKREQYLPFAEVFPIIEDVLCGLCAAHAADVIHRDLKPGNIFIERTASPERPERAKILDFGISKLKRGDGEQHEPTLTAFDATLGSFAYMAPEQVRGAARADERADIYAVGAVAFRSLSGRLPFEGTTAALLVAMKLERQAPSLAEATGDRWPAGIERFLERALERKRENRFATAREALDGWRTLAPGGRVIQPPPPVRAPAPSTLNVAPPDPPTVADEADAGVSQDDQPTWIDHPPTETVDTPLIGQALDVSMEPGRGRRTGR